MQCYFLASKAAAFIAEKLSRSFTFMFLDYSIYVLTAVCCWFICIWRASTFQLLYPARTCEIKPEALRKNSIWCVSLRICFYMWWFVAVRSLPTPGLLRWTLQDPTLSCWEHLHPICCHSKGACSAHLLQWLEATWRHKFVLLFCDKRSSFQPRYTWGKHTEVKKNLSLFHPWLCLFK